MGQLLRGLEMKEGFACPTVFQNTTKNTQNEKEMNTPEGNVDNERSGAIWCRHYGYDIFWSQCVGHKNT